MLGLIGTKVGMTQIFDEVGNVIPVTMLKVEKNYVVGQRDEAKNGYNAVVLGTIPVKEKRVTKPYIGQFKNDIKPTKYLREFRNYDQDCKVGDALDIDLFENVEFVDVVATSKGKGYQGVMKRHGFHGGRKTHGSKFHRAPGSTGMAAWPSRVIKGTRMPGRMGADRKTVQNLKVVKIDKEQGLLLVKGSVPGTKNTVVLIAKANKK
jgi:large subunit ribosomal protein L3